MSTAQPPRGYFRSRLARLDPPRRSPGIDLARALAVIGMFAAHLLAPLDLVWSDPASWRGVVDGRSSILFATLAGVSLALTEDRRPGDDRAAMIRSGIRISVRALLIWSLGALLVAWTVPVHVILQAYGILFLLAILLLRLPTPALLTIATITAFVGPLLVAWINQMPVTDYEFAESWFQGLGWNYPFPAWAAFVAAGIAVGRFLRRATAVRAALLLAVGSLLALVGYGVIGPIGNPVAEEAAAFGSSGSFDTVGGLDGSWFTVEAWSLAVLQDEPHSTGVGEMVGSGGFAVAVIGLCALIGLSGLSRPLWPLRALGSMPLSAYTAHLVIWIWWVAAEEARLGVVISSPGLAFRELDPFWPMTLGMLVGCSLWAILIGRGPLEALLARLTGLVTLPPRNWGARRRRPQQPDER